MVRKHFKEPRNERYQVFVESEVSANQTVLFVATGGHADSFRTLFDALAAKLHVVDLARTAGGSHVLEALYEKYPEAGGEKEFLFVNGTLLGGRQQVRRLLVNGEQAALGSSCDWSNVRVDVKSDTGFMVLGPQNGFACVEDVAENEEIVAQLEARPLYTVEELRDFDATTLGWLSMPIALQSRNQRRRSKLLVCHDMKGGYQEDRFKQGCDDFDAYRFYQWDLVDIFVYFGHALVCPPPVGWVTAGHRHGTRVLGTFLTEGDQGAVQCQELFKDVHSAEPSHLLHVGNIVNTATGSVKGIISHDMAFQGGASVQLQGQLVGREKAYFKLFDVDIEFSPRRVMELSYTTATREDSVCLLVLTVCPGLDRATHYVILRSADDSGPESGDNRADPKKSLSSVAKASLEKHFYLPVSTKCFDVESVTAEAGQGITADGWCKKTYRLGGQLWDQKHIVEIGVLCTKKIRKVPGEREDYLAYVGEVGVFGSSDQPVGKAVRHGIHSQPQWCENAKLTSFVRHDDRSVSFGVLWDLTSDGVPVRYVLVFARSENGERVFLGKSFDSSFWAAKCPWPLVKGATSTSSTVLTRLTIELQSMSWAGQSSTSPCPTVLHGYVADKVQAALGKAMPQMEVRFKNLSISAKVFASRHSDHKAQLPTLYNSVKKSAAKINAKNHTAEKIILKNASGVFKPGTITLVLGQPGSGKSSLMKVLSGRFPLEKNVSIEGDITYNGQKQADIMKRLPQFVAYVTQRDKHFPTLTVKETLEFAHAFCGGQVSKRAEELLSKGTTEVNTAALDALTALYEHYPDVIIKQLGLENCKNTIVGNAMLRGVSGGERKRVTTGEMEFGMKYMTLMDEISTGLDSAATYDIISTQRGIAKTLQKTVVIALLQPSPEVFALFDDVMILNEGEVMYHGPRDQAVPFFESLGFKCPPDRDEADFLLDLGTNQQHSYEVDLPAGMVYHPRSASEFAEIFRRSAIHQRMLQALDDPHRPELLRNVGAHMDHMPEFRRGFWENTRTLMKRQTMVTLRNTAFIKGRCLMVVLMGLIYASTFWQVDPTDVQVALGVMFQAVLFLALGQVSQIPTFMAARDVFYKQRGANFFPTSAYVLACSVAQIPMAIAESVIFGSLVYWMCGFVATAGAFICYMILLILTNLVFSSWFFLLTAMSPDFHIAKPFATFTIVFFILFAGFVMAKSTMPGWFVWIYWINPIAWCLRGLAVNQYRASKFDVCVYAGVDYCNDYNMTMGEYYLSQYDVPSSKVWVWAAMLFMIACYALFMALGWYVLEYHRYESPEHTIIKDNDKESDDSYALAATPKNSSTSSGARAIALDVEREKNFVPVTIAFQDLWYSVPMPGNPKESLDLLKGISGFAKPGTMTALMGSSGAGKTTLMDVIAGRKTGGKITGKILFNGFEATDLAIRRCTGYCEQMDIHSDASTFREAFTFSAFLRQDSSVPASKKYDSVNECLDLLDMHDIADQIIRGSSVEQMKRLTIGVELAAQPSVLFLDEPTSGLDARSAKLIMDGVRKVADSGRTIVCTIHQPSSDVFYLFDHLLLLKRGGETVFVGELGEKCRKLVEYFESIPGSIPLPKGYNPATWMLEVIGAGVGHAAGTTDFVEYFKNSEEKRTLDTEMEQEGVTVPAPDLPEMIFQKKRAASSWTQAKFLTMRFLRMYWRTPTYNMTRFIIGLFLAVLFGLTYVDVEYVTYQGINGGVGMVFMTTLFNGIVSFNGVLPIASGDRAAFYRERASQTYNSLWYFVGSTIAEIPYVFISCLLFTVIFYPLVGFTGFGTGVLYWVNISLLVLMQTYMGQLFVYALPSVEVAAIIGVLINSIFFLFMGFNPPANSIPEGYRWLYTITPQKYSLSILMALVFTDCPNEPTWNSTLGVYENVGSELACQPVTSLPITIDHITVKEYVESVFEMKHADIWSNFGYVFLFIGALRLLALLSLRYINHQKR
ncbi:hypothetical protein BBO99_00009251 [Phytophthora kernoviae]|uniref:ABC transporter domain-containing protein n=1 Tax=Phytophthora kernoviae TaxID=325452 RepID=A0A3R7KEU9_9STRA|nr:hypothetical protein BBI17_009255 [Phytophthora kernoviae]RLN73759.1 hypothetical protein BBO99_00009251 [Phytophthora kernoviae]